MPYPNEEQRAEQEYEEECAMVDDLMETTDSLFRKLKEYKRLNPSSADNFFVSICRKYFLAETEDEVLTEETEENIKTPMEHKSEDLPF